MQLKRLEAYGFKSFAERIVVQFDRGITAVVGPNGSGKSNITDAVRWVLGEQNIRMLRGLRSEDIIFSGSAARRALSVAEVVLVFDNRDKTLPIDYDEVVVKRRLYRNGDSEIYLNDSRCRIKDIYQLFADTGIGHDGMSIIGQNRLNDILDSRPEDRRVFFEETAGITKYRTRKQEALRKLRENEGDLVRLGDIMCAHREELEPLSIQAKKTMQFRKLDEERRQYLLVAMVQQYDQLIREQEAVRTESERLHKLLLNGEYQLAQQERSRIAVQHVLARLREELAVALNTVRTGDEDRRQQKEEYERRRGLLADVQNELESKLRQIDLTAEELQNISQERDCLRMAAEDLRKTIEHGEAALRTTDLERTRIRQTLDFQQRVQDSYEGFGRDVQTVLQAAEGWRNGIAGTVADLISIPERYLLAIDVALGGSVRNIVTEDTDTAKAAISYLKRKNGGRVTFLPLTTITVRRPREIDQRCCQGIIGWANTLVQAEGRFQKVIDHLLAQTLVMETLDEALIMAKQEGYRLRIVTLTGELLNPGGSLSGGGRSKQKTTLLNRRTEIDAMSRELHACEETYREQSSVLEEQRTLLKESNVKYAEHKETANRLAQTLMEERGKCDVLRERISDQTKMIHAMEQEEETRLAHGAKMAQRRTQIERHTAQCEEHEMRFAQAIVQLNERCAGLRSAGRKQEEHLHELDISLAALSAEIETRERNRNSRELDHAEAEKSLKDITEQREQLADELQKDEVRLSELESDIADQDALYQDREKSSAVLRDQRLAHEAEARVLDAAVRNSVAKIEAVRAKQHEYDKRLERTLIRMEDCRGSILSDFGLTPESAAAQVQAVEQEFLDERLCFLENAINGLGAVNPNAVEEYEEKKKRYESEEAQIQDLKAAKQDIEHIIRKIDEDMTRRFRDAFHQIQEYFNEIFVRLFGGGVAELRLTDKEDILSSGVEILVTLPEKKRQNLSALSGGERALTVIALLFSFLRYRPSPFSILDEIDAALDEANVSRFGEFLQEFAKDTQFIVVTHRKGTMRAADTMYGVTVEDAGVSKVLSIRLKDYESEQSA